MQEYFNIGNSFWEHFDRCMESLYNGMPNTEDENKLLLDIMQLVQNKADHTSPCFELPLF